MSVSAEDTKAVKFELEMGSTAPPPPATSDQTPKSTNINKSPQDASSTNATTIVDEARECLAQSNLMFLYADLRLLSATGRINTKFETLCIDSDRVPRTTASQMAQLPDEIQTRRKELIYTEGVSPAQIMAILIVELRKEVLAYRKRVKMQLEKEDAQGTLLSSVVGGGHGHAVGNEKENDTDDSDSDDADEDAGVMNTVTNAKGRKDFETGMHQMVRAHNDMLYKDMKGMPEVQVSKAVFHKPHFAPFRSVFSSDEGEFDESTNNSLQQSWLASLRKPSGEMEGGGGGEGGEGGKVMPLKAVVAAKMLLRKTKATPKEDMSNIALDVKAPPVGEEPPRKMDTLSSGGLASDGTGRSRKLSGIIEGDENGLPVSRSASTLGKEGDAEEKNEEGDDAFPDVEAGGNTNAPVHPMQGYAMGKDDALDVPLRRPSRAVATRRGSALTRQLTTRIHQYREDHALYNKGMVGFINTDDYDTFNGAETVGNQLMRMRNSIIAASQTSPSDLGESTLDSGRNMSEKELLDYMTKCIESREPDRLDFMSDFFRENTVSWTMVKSKTRIVWLQDWFPIKDPIYGIAVDKEKKRVLVVFRGAITRPDWGHAFDHALVHTRNPIKGDYEGRTDTIKMHRGFYRYLLRTRKDTMTRKYDEIANKVYEYGSEIIGEDFTVTVNGYSLGGALSLLFGFYASTDERFTKNGPVKIFTYGAPYVAGHTFADAFRHQERSKKVQCARFYNNNDVVAHLPVNIKMTKRGSPFVPLGIDVKLYPAPGQVSCCGSRAPGFKYNKKQSPVKAYFTALKMNCFLNTTWPWKIQPTHGLPELQKRLVMAVQVAKKEAEERTEDPFLHKTLDELYDELVYKKAEKSAA